MEIHINLKRYWRFLRNGQTVKCKVLNDIEIDVKYQIFYGYNGLGGKTGKGQRPQGRNMTFYRVTVYGDDTQSKGSEGLWPERTSLLPESHVPYAYSDRPAGLRRKIFRHEMPCVRHQIKAILSDSG